MRSSGGLRTDFLTALGRPFLGEELFDRIPDTVYFVKDRTGRYVAVNDTLVRRCGFEDKASLVGRTTREVFPPPLGEAFARQDEHVVASARPIIGQLELHLYRDRRQGWCLTWKEPLFEATGRVTGLAGISRDLPAVLSAPSELRDLSAALDHIRANLDRPLKLPELAAFAKLSVFQFDRRIRDLFGLSAGQYVTRARIELACGQLTVTDAPINRIALDCGYSDQAAFTRQFRKSTGLTPRAYRERRG